MTLLKSIEKEKERIPEYVKASKTLKQVVALLGYSDHSRNTSALRGYLVTNNIDFSHFSIGPSSKADWKVFTCPVCDLEFTQNVNSDKQKVTCSYSCANTYFRTGKSAGFYKNGSSTYKKVCRSTCEKHNIPFACVVCGFADILDVHHADMDKLNVDPVNLIPICANHHNLWHRDKPDYITEKIVEYQDRISSSLA